MEFVWSQILQGIGGGFVVVSAQVGGQASVAHVDIAMATAFILLFAWVGGAVGSAIGTLSGPTSVISSYNASKNTFGSWRNMDQQSTQKFADELASFDS